MKGRGQKKNYEIPSHFIGKKDQSILNNWTTSKAILMLYKILKYSQVTGAYINTHIRIRDRLGEIRRNNKKNEHTSSIERRSFYNFFFFLLESTFRCVFTMLVWIQKEPPSTRNRSASTLYMSYFILLHSYT